MKFGNVDVLVVLGNVLAVAAAIAAAIVVLKVSGFAPPQIPGAYEAWAWAAIACAAAKIARP